MKLTERYQDLKVNQLMNLVTRSNSYLGEELLNYQGKQLNLERVSLDTNTAAAVIDTVLAGVELPKIYRHANEDGSYDVLFGKEVLNTIYSVLLDESQKEFTTLYNMFWLVNLQFVTFDPKVPRDVACAYAQTAIDLI
jgi:hypothetical protein